MITRELKLKLTKAQEKQLSTWLWNLTGIYNWAIKKIKLNAKDKIYYSKLDFQNLLSDHGKKLGMPSHTIQGTLIQAYSAWNNCFKKISKEPKLKGVHNKLNSIPFPDVIPRSRLTPKTIRIPLLGITKYFKQPLPEGNIKNARIIKRASGWYIQLTLDAIPTFPVKNTTEKVGIDTGFKHLAVLSNGVKYENPRNYIKSQKRLGQAQRGNRKHLTSRLHERIKNQRKDNNHKVAREIVENYSEIYITNDNLRGQSKIFGKSVMDAGINQLRQYLIYKSENHNRLNKLVASPYTTMTCAVCESRTGPTGLHGLAVRDWVCSACGAVLDRDVNSANVILNVGLGCNLVAGSNPSFKQESSGGAR